MLMAMTMAHSLTQTNLAPLDEGMEISSDAGGNMNNDDIDIDIDIEEYRHDGINDENMIDDATDDRQHTIPDASSRDDVMVDEDGIFPAIEDGLMEEEEEEFVIEDQELVDVHDNEADPAVTFQTQNIFQPPPAVSEPAHNDQTTFSNLNAVADTDNVSLLNDTEIKDTTQPVLLETDQLPIPEAGERSVEIKNASFDDLSATRAVAVGIDNELITNQDPTIGAEEGKIGEDKDKEKEAYRDEEETEVNRVEENADTKQSTPTISQIETNPNAAIAKHETTSVEEEEEEEQEKPQVSHEKAPEPSLTNRGEASETVAPFSERHPVIVVYEDEEIYLFPPSNGDTEKSFFLNDPSFLETPIQELLTACRHVLGENIDADVQLEMDIPELGLAVHEDSHDASKTKFSDILYVYVKLCHNDAIQEPEPLYVTLTSKTRFASRLDELSHAAKQGLGLSVMNLGDDSDIVDSAENDASHVNDQSHTDESLHEGNQEDEIHFDHGLSKDSELQPTAIEDQEDQDADAASQPNESTLDFNAAEVSGNVTFEEGDSTHQPTETRLDEAQDELIDFGDAGDDPDLVDDENPINIPEDAAIGATWKDEDAEYNLISTQAPSSVVKNVDGPAVSRGSPEPVGHKNSTHSIDQDNEIEYDDFDEADTADLSQHELSCEKVETGAELLENPDNNEAEQDADEEWYQDEFGEGGEEDDEPDDADADAEAEPEAKVESDTKSTHVPSVDAKSISRKRSRDEAEFENDAIDLGGETKKARPTSA